MKMKIRNSNLNTMLAMSKNNIINRKWNSTYENNENKTSTS